MMKTRIAGGIHELDCEIDALCRGIRLRGRHDVFLAQDWCVALDQQASSLIAIGNDAFSKDEAFAGFEFDLEAHVMPLPS